MLMSGHLRNLGENIRMLQKGIDDTEDVAAWTTLQPQIADAPARRISRPGPGSIEFRDVTFRYKAAGAPLYDHFSLKIAPGERVATGGSHRLGKVDLRQAGPAPARPAGTGRSSSTARTSRR
ncbi:hypothetical protein ACRAWD_12465 [Caulobacter segnis]